MPRGRNCFWCGPQEHRLTDDHLVPKWALKIIPTTRIAMLAGLTIKVRVCPGCNNDKSAMPPAEYARYRLNAQVMALQRGVWQAQAFFARRQLLAQSAEKRSEFVGMVIEAMAEPFEHDGRAYAPRDDARAIRKAIAAHEHMIRSTAGSVLGTARRGGLQPSKMRPPSESKTTERKSDQ